MNGTKWWRNSEEGKSSGRDMGWVEFWKVGKNKHVMSVFYAPKAEIFWNWLSIYLLFAVGSWSSTRYVQTGILVLRCFWTWLTRMTWTSQITATCLEVEWELEWFLEAWIISLNIYFTLLLNPIWSPTLPLLSGWPSDCTWYSRPFTLWSQPFSPSVLSFFLKTLSNSIQVKPSSYP